MKNDIYKHNEKDVYFLESKNTGAWCEGFLFKAGSWTNNKTIETILSNDFIKRNFHKADNFTYPFLKSIQPPYDRERYFYAFDKKQYEEGKNKKGITNEKIYSTSMGAYGTKQALDKFFNFVENLWNIHKRYCTPQSVYNYEYLNHECGYTGDDSQAIEIVKLIFGKNVEIERKFYYVED